MFTPASLIAWASSASAPGLLSTSMTRSTAIGGYSRVSTWWSSTGWPTSPTGGMTACATGAPSPPPRKAAPRPTSPASRAISTPCWSRSARTAPLSRHPSGSRFSEIVASSSAPTGVRPRSGASGVTGARGCLPRTREAARTRRRGHCADRRGGQREPGGGGGAGSQVREDPADLRTSVHAFGGHAPRRGRAGHVSDVRVVAADEAARARAWVDDSQAAVCDVIEPWEHGTVVRTTRYPSYWTTTSCASRTTRRSAEELVRLADEALAGLAHRRVGFEVVSAGEPIAANSRPSAERSRASFGCCTRAPRRRPPASTSSRFTTTRFVTSGVAWHAEDFPGLEVTADTWTRRAVWR